MDAPFSFQPAKMSFVFLIINRVIDGGYPVEPAGEALLPGLRPTHRLEGGDDDHQDGGCWPTYNHVDIIKRLIMMVIIRVIDGGYPGGAGGGKTYFPAFASPIASMRTGRTTSKILRAVFIAFRFLYRDLPQRLLLPVACVRKQGKEIPTSDAAKL